MSNIDFEYELMMEGRLNLMHLPPGAIAWLWDRPKKQVDAAESLATAARAYDNPITDASLLRSDQNILILKCEGGECFRIYPDGGYSYDNTPMDMGGCSSVLRGDWCGCPHKATETNPLADMEHDGMEEDMGNDEHLDDEDPMAAQDVIQNVTNLGAEPYMDENMGNDEHLDDEDPEAGWSPHNITNLAGDPTRDVDEDQGGDWGGPGTGDGMGSGTPYVGVAFIPDDEMMDALNDVDEDEFGHECLDYSDEELDELARATGTY